MNTETNSFAVVAASLFASGVVLAMTLAVLVLR